MLADQRAVDREEQNGAIERPAIALDHPHHDLHGVRPRGLADRVAFGARHGDRARMVSSEPVAAVARPKTDTRAKIHAPRVTTDERLGEQRQFRALRCRIRGKTHQLVERCRGIEQAGCGLNYGDFGTENWGTHSWSLAITVGSGFTRSPRLSLSRYLL